MPSGNLQIVNASQEDEGTYKCAAYNPVTQEVKTSVSSERLRVRRKPLSLHCTSPALGAQTSAVAAGFLCEPLSVLRKLLSSSRRPQGVLLGCVYAALGLLCFLRICSW